MSSKMPSQKMSLTSVILLALKFIDRIRMAVWCWRGGEDCRTSSDHLLDFRGDHHYGDCF